MPNLLSARASRGWTATGWLAIAILAFATAFTAGAGGTDEAQPQETPRQASSQRTVPTPVEGDTARVVVPQLDRSRGIAALPKPRPRRRPAAPEPAPVAAPVANRAPVQRQSPPSSNPTPRAPAPAPAPAAPPPPAPAAPRPERDTAPAPTPAPTFDSYGEEFDSPG
jgi:translation initiation factor IF-2